MNQKLSEQELIRRQKIEKLQKLGVEVFHETVKFDLNINKIIQKYNSFSKDELAKDEFSLSTTGRIITIRSSFLVLKSQGSKFQIYLPIKELDKKYLELIDLLDIGDIIFVNGKLMKTQTGELTLRANELKLLSKSLKVLPDKFHGLNDIEERYRHRYVDLIVNDDVRKTFLLRSRIISLIRKYFDNLEYLEVDTPVLQPILGGASAKPFITKFNALNSNFYLRIATELPLKKLVVGGFDRVYEIGRIFRNEGVDTTHNPEFTSIEYYEAYSNNEGMMNRTEDLFKFIAKELNLKTIFFNGYEIDLNKPFRRLNMVEALNEKLGIDLYKISFEDAKVLAKKHHIKVESYFKIGHIINELFELFIEKDLIQPTFVYGHPIEISPLANKNKKNPNFTDRAELFIGTKEYANMFTELTDPIDQLERFKDQQNEKDNGNEEANEIDYDFVEALEYGLPPTGGCGIGIDRLVMLFTNNESIREVLLFPHLKNK
ncbi:lysine--tRNA ligase [[Mycoplasma] mobile]|uniref:Lysine--tRNA ligase n=1 Tax=Mycoplasma mobile (strain ATCC 43663 / 163K / NCTC 11711) TaxID=267748 RepID=SYK_MYCM1|nr:lysine--tRNA ligase [[Mycoplasma] mobile]Q6KIP6.1 RecName: Full=Lysine--tRNA ligase; AltName: Full=Lysyl-tRNA synthetase; Short=LysRS [Mycoplasma mobile 163K]AAT27530.1 lysyl-tRNA synthetase [Mycoplasma mobile 163K]